MKKLRKTVVFFLLGTLAAQAVAGDWFAWRGPDQRGMARENAPLTSWSQDGQNVLWKSDVGGRSVPIVMNGRVFLIGPVGEGVTLGERIVALDANTGKTLWENRFNVFHTDIVENRVGWTALAGDPETGNIYAHGTGGELFCLDRDGKVVWKHSLAEEFGRFSGYGGRLYTPVVDEDRVIIGIVSTSWGDQAPMGHRLIAFDKRNGQVVWIAALGERPLDTTYATPAVAMIGGRRLLIAPAADGWIYALEARSGKPAWKFRLAGRPLNTSPVVAGDYVYCSHSEENYDTTVMGRLICINGVGTGDITKSGEVWRYDGIDAGYASPAFHNGRLYVVDNGSTLHCFDAKAGKPLWTFKLGTIGRGSPVVTTDGVIYVAEQNGAFHILKDAGDKAEALDSEQLAKKNGATHEIQGSPAIANGRVYLQTRYHTFCLGLKDPPKPEFDLDALRPPGDLQIAGAGPRPGMEQPATLIVPAEITLAPGEKIQLNLRDLPRMEQEVRGAAQRNYEWTVAGVKGTLEQNAAGALFTAAPDAAFSAGAVKVKWTEGQEGVARVRICPKLPIVEDFEKYAVDGNPPGWLNTVQKTKVVERDGSKVLKTLSERPSPIFMRLRTYFAPSLAGGYTIEADVLGTPRPPRWKPDMGLVNSRYEMLLLGSEPTLRITTWPPIPRLQRDVPFEWKTDTWYRMKLQVKLEGDKAVVRGKVWPRGESEPSAWMIEVEDPFPNREGSPALYAYAAGTTEKKKGTEIFFDNVKVTGNSE